MADTILAGADPGKPRLHLALAYGALILSSLSFASNWIVGRGLAESVPPVATAFWRWTVACIVLAPFAIGPLRRDIGLLVRSWRIVLLLAVLGVGLFQILAYWGLRSTTATNGALLNSSIPMLVVILSVLFFGLRLTWTMAAGVLLSLAGVITIIIRGDADVLIGLRFNRGDMLILAAMMIWALYTIALRWRPANLNQVSLLAATFGIGWAITAVFYALELAFGIHGHYDRAAVAGLVWIGVFPSLVAYFCWSIGVAAVGAARAGVFSHLIPVFAALLAMGILGERLQGYHLAGFALVVVGIALSNRR